MGGNSEYKGSNYESKIYTINLITGKIDDIVNITGCNWTTMPIYFSDLEFNVFLNGEEKDGCPSKIALHNL